MLLALHMCCFWTLSSHVLLDSCCCWEEAALHTTRQQQGYKKNIQLIISFNRSSKHIRLISKLHFNSWFVISCTKGSWNPIILHLCSVQLLVLQMKRAETNWTWSNTALASSVNFVRFIAASVFWKHHLNTPTDPDPDPRPTAACGTGELTFFASIAQLDFPAKTWGHERSLQVVLHLIQDFRRRREVQCEVVTLFWCWGHLFISHFW